MTTLKPFVFILFNLFYIRHGQHSTVSFRRLAYKALPLENRPFARQVNCCRQQRSRQCAEYRKESMFHCFMVFYRYFSLRIVKLTALEQFEPVLKKLLVQVHGSDVIHSIQVQVRQNYVVRFPSKP
jgi:hypothetical protein